jgi:TrmH family RNA methyltransferase
MGMQFSYKQGLEGRLAMRWKRYDRDSPYSHSIGVFPTLELLTQQPEQVREVVLSSMGHRNQGVSKIEDLCRRRQIPCKIDDPILQRLSSTENTYAIGFFQKYQPPWDSDASQVVLVEPSDLGNLGTIVRTMVGLGLPRLALIRPAADLFHPKAIRASMGALFHLSFHYFDSYSVWHKQFPGTVYAFFTDGASDLEEIAIRSPHAFVFGNEGAGLPIEISQGANTVRIAFQSMIDSLSLPVAVGIALYQAQNRQAPEGV